MAKATREAFGEALLALGEKKPNLVVLDADLSKSTMTSAFAKKYPERHFELGIAEQNMIGIGAGMALCGKIPVVTSFACFLAGRLETIRVSAAYNRTNLKLVGTHAGLGIGEDGNSQMGLEDVGALRALPHMTILQPADALETRQAVEWMIAHEGPVYLRLTRQKMEDCHAPDYRFQPGKADVLWEPDAKPKHFQATIFASGGPVPHALKAGRELLARGFSVRVVNACSLKPFDREAVARAASDSQRLVTVEDHNVNGGLGSAVCEAAAELGLGVPVLRLGAHDFGESGSCEQLYAKYGLSSAHIVEACLKNL
ncbi:MAG: transketolase family protein [Elusimicrobia bacterium]|nr:transketolase family protein [Elusimicrobiota bacterium]